MDGYGRRMYDKNGKYIQPKDRAPARGVQRAPLQRQNALYGKRAFNSSMAKTIGIAAPLYPKPELKFFDVTENVAAIAGWNGMVGSGAGILNAIPVGTGSSNRIGRTVIAKSFQLRWAIDVAAAGPTLGRVIVICTKSAVVGTIGQILTTTTTQNGLINLAYSDQFEVLLDKYPQRDQQLQTARSDSYYKKLNHEIMFDPAGAANPLQGQIYVFFFCTAGTVNMTTRVRYIDC